MISRITLLSPVQSLLTALTSSPTSPAYISTILSTFTIEPPPFIHEHGLLQLAPFLGRTFTGTDGIARYFELLAESLSISNMTFEPEETWLVDDDCMAVVLRGRARFRWKRTGQGWEETFIYRVALAEERGGDIGSGGGVDMARAGASPSSPATASDDSRGKGNLKVVEYQVWADTGAAYLARMGKLGDLMGEKGGVEGIYFAREDGEGDVAVGDKEMEARKMEGRETQSSLNRKKSGHQDILGSGLNVYGSCG
ncbi:hypothetical protein PMG11_05690 [Penicillium brasilianum]|uniref:SnoaL-like domain-containing protein n=1 Tax=Penicillium brasilianum TaxID=104259 RepID=A0A0F7TNK8_PENBI|nr:hypothetical protein PMG11_05690 [Penicillium brasilianum]